MPNVSGVLELNRSGETDLETRDQAVEKELRTPAKPTKKRWSKTLVNFWLDTALMVAFVILAIVAVIVQFVFPPGTVADGWTIWGMTYGQWCSLQFGLIATLAIGILVNVMLHWPWVCGVISKRILKRDALADDGIRFETTPQTHGQ